MVCLADELALTTPFLLIFAFGFFYVSGMSFMAQCAGREVEAEEPKPADLPVEYRTFACARPRHPAFVRKPLF